MFGSSDKAEAFPLELVKAATPGRAIPDGSKKKPDASALSGAGAEGFAATMCSCLFCASLDFTVLLFFFFSSDVSARGSGDELVWLDKGGFRCQQTQLRLLITEKIRGGGEN